MRLCQTSDAVDVGVLVPYCDWFGARRPTTRQKLVLCKRHLGNNNVVPSLEFLCPGGSFEFVLALPNNAPGKLIQNLRRFPMRDDGLCVSH